jgi:hypothetical protein
MSTAFSDAPRLTTPGRSMWACPTGVTPVIVPPPGCVGCPLEEAHGVAAALSIAPGVDPPGGRYGLINSAERPDVEALHRLQSAIWLRDHIARGLVGDDTLYNIGEGGANASTAWTYEVLGGGPGFLDLRGPNPRMLTSGTSRLNPEWPLPDPIEGTLGRLVWKTRTLSMPAGAVVSFAWPSALHGKVHPIITRVLPPNTNDPVASFRVEVGSFDCSNANQPWDAAFPAPAYHCEVRVEVEGAAHWKDFQAPRERSYVRRTVTLAAGAVRELLASDGTGTRVLPPGSVPAALVVRLGEAVIFREDWAQRLLQDNGGPGGSERTRIDFTGTGLEDEELVVSYYCRAREGDAGFFPVSDACVHSRRDRSGSWDTGGGEHCAERDRATGTHAAGCWATNCSRFRLRDPLDMDDAEWLAGLWGRAGFVIRQGVPGQSSHRNFSLSQRGGPSILAMAGGFAAGTPAGIGAGTVTEWAEGAYGRRITWEVDGDEGQGHVAGGLWLRPYAFPEADPVEVYAPTAFGALQAGNLTEMAGWTVGKVGLWPHRYSAGARLDEFTATPGSLRNVNSPAPSEAYVVAVDPSLARTGGQGSRLRAIYGGGG